MKSTSIVVCAYRDWAKNICKHIYANYTWSDEPHEDRFIVNSIVENHKNIGDRIRLSKPDLVFFLGWSWIIPDDIINDYRCICLHPSPLPKYRGGSPIQHQMINGEKTSKVSMFLMDEGLDTGPIIWQSKNFSLDGDLSEILTSITNAGKDGVDFIINQYQKSKSLITFTQDHSKATSYKRRKPEQSEIEIEDFTKFTAKELVRKIKSLQSPYPNAYIKCKNGTILYITNASTK